MTSFKNSQATFAKTKAGMKAAQKRSSGTGAVAKARQAAGPGPSGYNPATGTASRSTRSGPPGAVSNPAPAARPWKQRLGAARKRLAGAAPAEVEAGLNDPDPAVRYTALFHAFKGRISPSDQAVSASLAGAQDPRVAQAAVRVLSARDTPAARAALAEHIAQGGPGRDLAEAHLKSVDPEGLAKALARDPRRDALIRKIRRGGGSKGGVVEAIQELARYPGQDVDQILRQLSGDWSPEVAAAARGALEERASQGP